MSYTDYIYRTKDDEYRFRIYKHIDDYDDQVYWNYDVFRRDKGFLYNYAVEHGDLYYKKKDAKADIERQWGKLTSINPSTVTEGWE